MGKGAWAFVGFCAGTAWGVFGTYADHLVSRQQGWMEGRESVLNQKVIVGGEPFGPCSVEIPLSVLADMVEIGVIDWHEACTQETTDD